MGDNLDRMKRAAASKPAPQPKAPPPPPKAKGKDVLPPKPPKCKFRCGHSFTEFEVSARDCAACTLTNRAAKRRAYFERKGRHRDGTPAQRLPDGSVKVLRWDGASWHGTLTVPGIPGEFFYVAPSERLCYHGLHREYERVRDAGKDNPAPRVEGGEGQGIIPAGGSGHAEAVPPPG